MSIKEVALEEGMRATFMPKPFGQHPGSAMHTHMSLFEGEVNAFHSPDDPLQLSDVAKSFIAGMLEHAAEITAVCNQWVNSYKRLGGGGERSRRRGTRRRVRWGHDNRSALIRVPMYKPQKAATRPGSSSGPSTRPATRTSAFAVILSAGLQGIEADYELAARCRGRRLGADQRRAQGPRGYRSRCRQNLVGRVQRMQRSELVAETLGEHVFDFFLRNKRERMGWTTAARSPSSSCDRLTLNVPPSFSAMLLGPHPGLATVCARSWRMPPGDARWPGGPWPRRWDGR